MHLTRTIQRNKLAKLSLKSQTLTLWSDFYSKQWMPTHSLPCNTSSVLHANRHSHEAIKSSSIMGKDVVLIYNGILSVKNEMVLLAATWMQLMIIILEK